MQVADHVDSKTGEVLWWSFTYNQVPHTATCTHSCTGNLNVPVLLASANECGCRVKCADQGVAIGASLAMYNTSGNHMYVDNAVLTAQFMTRNQTTVVSCGISGTSGSIAVLFDGANCADATCAQFKGIGFRYIFAKHSNTPRWVFLAVPVAAVLVLRCACYCSVLL